MHRALLGIAGLAIAASPASSQSFATGDFGASSSFRNSGFVNPSAGMNMRRDYSGDHRRDRRGGDHRRGHDGRYDYAPYGYLGYGYYPGDYDANRSFDPDRWNDWWHERPERAFPRWVWSNQNCTEDRLWWSGAGWRCTP